MTMTSSSPLSAKADTSGAAPPGEVPSVDDEAAPGTPAPSMLITAGAPRDNGVSDAIHRVLRALRNHLALDVAFVSQVANGRRTFRFVDSDTGGAVRVGESDPAEQSYCHYVIKGDLPQALRDPASHPVAAALPVTTDLPVGTHFSVPITMSDGTVYGTFCGFSNSVREGLTGEEVGTLRVMADVVASYLQDEETRRSHDQDRRTQLQSLVSGHDLMTVFQPIVGVPSAEAQGYEALTRFPTLQCRPDEAFAAAWQVGVGPQLEMQAVQAALNHFPSLPDHTYMSINVSPATIATAAFYDAVRSRALDPGRIVVEVTEHAAVQNYDELLGVTSQLQALGIRLAVDDVGMGFSGLNHILRLRPDIIKIDAAVIRDIHFYAAKQAMLSALVSFAARTSTTAVAEGVETLSEWEMLHRLGVRHVQGYFTGRPRALEAPQVP